MGDNKVEPQSKPRLAKIRFLDGEKQGSWETITTDQIHGHIFTSCSFDKTMRYKLKDLENPDKKTLPRVQILCIAETNDALEEKTAKLRFPPAKNLVSASEESDDYSAAIDPVNNQAVKSVKKKPGSTFKLKTPSYDYNKILTDRRNEKMQEAKKRKVNENQNNLEISSFDKENNKLENCMDQESSSNLEVKSKEKNLGQFLKPKPVIKDVVELLEVNETLKIKEKEILKLKEGFKQLERKYKNLKDEYKELERKYEEVQRINLKMQEEVIVDISKIRILMDQKSSAMASNAKVIDPKLNDLPIGFKERNGSVHIGDNYFMEVSTHDNLISDSSSPSTFVGNILLAVFGRPVLENSTVTGRKSNRTIGKQKILNEEDDDASDVDNSSKSESNKTAKTPNKLEARLLNICKGYYEFWLEFYYEKELDRKSSKKYDRAVEISNFNDYATKKIASLKSKTRKSKKSLKDPLAILDQVTSQQDETEDDTPPFANVILLKSHSDLLDQKERSDEEGDDMDGKEGEREDGKADGLLDEQDEQEDIFDEGLLRSSSDEE